ncbi:MAG TPA: Maf family protein [Pseudogracilibacillus sp.]|nr:Maf family protein [Pseudogracilibacillus sp.]
MKKLILASSSPRRRELLNQVGLNFSVRRSYADESQITTTDPEEKVKQLATLKGRHVPIHQHDIIISADTVVSYQQKVFEKPKTKEEARQMMTSLSGEIHDVFTGVMIRSIHHEKVFVERTEVEFWPLSQKEIEWYVNTHEPYDKAGGYGIQNLGAVFVKRMNGDYFNVVGLPISRVVRELQTFGVDFTL